MSLLSAGYCWRKRCETANRSGKPSGSRTNVYVTSCPISRSKPRLSRRSCGIPRATGTVAASRLLCTAAPRRRRPWKSSTARPGPPPLLLDLRHPQPSLHWQTRLRPLLRRLSQNHLPVYANPSIQPPPSPERERRAQSPSTLEPCTTPEPSRVPPRILAPPLSPIVMGAPPPPCPCPLVRACRSRPLSVPPDCPNLVLCIRSVV